MPALVPRRAFSLLILVKGWYKGIIPKNWVLLPLGLLFPKVQSHSALFMQDIVDAAVDVVGEVDNGGWACMKVDQETKGPG